MKPYLPSVAYREARDDLKADLELLQLLESGQLRPSFGRVEELYDNVKDVVRQATEQSMKRYQEEAKKAGLP